MLAGRAITVLALAALAAGCAGGDGPSGDPCAEPDAPSAVIEDALALGLAGAGGFHPVADGGDLELVLGAQGGWMIAPVLAVDRATMASDGACVRVALEVDLGAGAPVGLELTLPELGGTDDHFYSEPLPVLLSYDLAALDGRTATISALVTDDGVASACELAATLVNRD